MSRGAFLLAFVAVGVCLWSLVLQLTIGALNG
ncbi:hypothetical protein M2152_002009 [Microbacteriaceae bacterium SG_E_30_P1]|uniref:Uncharacterized protein n=1 Tax=Antiquaquibacter oligotrophicus TaxID=2880260 RepID=A0ABT6KRW1_9MICO|nr:hypothetical protein [Antiquaquibacter oligotrophicus]